MLNWTWADLAPLYAELAGRPVEAASASAWLADWSALSEHVQELQERLWVATTVNTADAEATARNDRYLAEIFPQAEAAEQVLKDKLLALGVEPEGMAVPLRDLRADAAIFRTENLPIRAELLKLSTHYDQIVGAQTVVWEGAEVPLPQLQPALADPDRARREAAWRLGLERQLADYEAIGALWARLLSLRLAEATNAGRDYRLYRWLQLHRLDYSPQDCEQFQAAIEAVVVPAATRAYERRRQRLGLATLRPWDVLPDPTGLPPLRPFATVEELIAGCERIFQQVDPAFGEYFASMQQADLLDLGSRAHKAPGGYCDSFAASRRPFIFMNAVGLHTDVQTLLHEGGHAFHYFEASRLPYLHQQHVGWEFAEVASMSMELLAAPYLERSAGGFYSRAEAARARAEHLESLLIFWPYMAVVDAFQHWVYTHPAQAADPAACDATWDALVRRFQPGVDWHGLERERATGWQRKGHIIQEPFYYVEYGLAQLGAVMVWQNALTDQAGAVSRYRQALALGGTATLPQLFAAAGARLAFDAEPLAQAVDLMETTMLALEDALAAGV